MGPWKNCNYSRFFNPNSPKIKYPFSISLKMLQPYLYLIHPHLLPSSFLLIHFAKLEVQAISSLWIIPDKKHHNRAWILSFELIELDNFAILCVDLNLQITKLLPSATSDWFLLGLDAKLFSMASIGQVWVKPKSHW